MRTFRITTCAAALVMFLVPAIHAQDSNESRRLTYLTFSAPVQVPGVTLPAGTYRFQLASTQTSLHAVQIFSKDGKQLYTMFLTIPDVRPSADTPRKELVMFEERVAGAPQAIKEWFYAGNPAGEEFVYPRRQAVQLARVNHTTVPSTDDDRIKATGSESARAEALKDAPVARVNDTAAPASPREEGQVASARTLPRTASPLSLIELLSALCLTGGFAAGRIRRRVQDVSRD